MLIFVKGHIHFAREEKKLIICDFFKNPHGFTCAHVDFPIPTADEDAIHQHMPQLVQISEYKDKLNDISKTGNYKVVCLFVTDIISNNSHILYNESAKKILEDAFNIENLTEGHSLKDVVSRKLQMVPLIMERVEKI